MRTLILLGFVILLAPSFASPEAPSVEELYFGQAAPSDTPAVFAPGIISREGRFEQAFAYSPDGTELTFCTTNSYWSTFALHTMRLVDGSWTDPATASFLGSDTTGLTACLSFDTETAFFTAARPYYPPCDIWRSKREGGRWSEPQKMGPPISSKADEFEVTISSNGTLYFSSNRTGGRGDMDLYRARLMDGEYPEVENLGPPINTSSGDDLPCIAPDESYLIFASDRPGGLGNRDLYISFQVDGNWTEAQNLGSPINSELWDVYPSVSPDGKYLFFARRKYWLSLEDSDIYWVGTGFIDRLREKIIQK